MEGVKDFATIDEFYEAKIKELQEEIECLKEKNEELAHELDDMHEDFKEKEKEKERALRNAELVMNQLGDNYNRLLERAKKMEEKNKALKIRIKAYKKVLRW